MEGRSRVKSESMGQVGAFYLYTGFVPHGDFPTALGRPIPHKKTLKHDIKEGLKSTELWSHLFETTLDTLVLVLEHHEPGGPGTSVRQISRSLKGAHRVHIVEPRTGLAFDPKQNLPLNADNYILVDGLRGDPAEMKFQMGQVSPVARVWIVSTEPPENVNQNQEINASSAVVFFSKDDALHFIQNVKIFSSAPEIEDILSLPALSLPPRGDIHDSMPTIFMLYRTVSELLSALPDYPKQPFASGNRRIDDIVILSNELYSALPTRQIKEELRKAAAEFIALQKPGDSASQALHYDPKHGFEIDESEFDIERINNLTQRLTDQLKNYLILYSSNLASPQPDPGEALILKSLAALANMAQMQISINEEYAVLFKELDNLEKLANDLYDEVSLRFIEENENNLSFSGDESGSEADKSASSSPISRLKTETLGMSGDAFFSPVQKRRHADNLEDVHQSEKNAKKEKEESPMPSVRGKK